MATGRLPLLSLAFVLIVCPVTVSSLTDKSSSGSGLGSNLFSRDIHLSDLSLPPEVITEVLFSQVDLAQDQLEQCEELVRDSLNGDSGPELPDDESSFDNDNDVKDDGAAKTDPSHQHQEREGDLETEPRKEELEEEGYYLYQHGQGVAAGDDEAEDQEREEKPEAGEGFVKSKDMGDQQDVDGIATPGESETPRDTIDSDAEERESPPEEVAAVENDSEKNHLPAVAGNTNDNADEVREGQVTTQSIPTRTMMTTRNTDDVRSFREQTLEPTTTSLYQSSETPTEAVGQTRQQHLEGSGRLDDNQSDGVRNKRSLSLEHVIMSDIPEGGRTNHFNGGSSIVLGKGRIRRHARQEGQLFSTVMEQNAPKSAEIYSLTELIQRPLKHRQDSMRSSRKTAVSSLGKHGEQNMNDHLFIATSSSPMPNTLRRFDRVIQMAEGFVSRQNLPRSMNTLDRADRLEVERLLATVRNPSIAERRRVRRSLEENTNPKRFVPLIGQLVDRLKYLQHSLAVCHRLQPSRDASHSSPDV